MKKIKKKKSKRKIFYIFFLFFIYLISFFITIRYRITDKDEIIKYLLNNSNYVKKKNNNKIITNLISFISDVDINNPVNMINNKYRKIMYKEEEADLKVEKIPISNYVKDPNPVKEEIKPLVYLYNTHQSETYAKSNNQDYNVSPTVMTVSYMLREKLNKNNIPTIVETNDITEFLRTNNWNYASSYKVSRILMEDAKNKNNNLMYFIDLHRDSVNKNISTVTINDKKYAKILFIVGLENPNYQENLALTESLNNMFDRKYPGLSRGIYKKQGRGVNGVYNQDFSNRTILIEVGGEENTIDEVNNTVDAISEILTEYIKEDSSGTW